jgi:hypothetical protein
MEETELDALQYAFDVGEPDEDLRKHLGELFKRSLQAGGVIKARPARFSLSRLYRIRDRRALSLVLKNIELLAPLGEIVPKYLHPWLRQKGVERKVTEFLQDDERNTSTYLSTWLMAVMLDTPVPLPDEWTAYARAIACDRSQPTFHRAVALNVLALSPHTHDTTRIEDIAIKEYDPEIVRAAVVALARLNRLTKAVATRACRVPGIEPTVAYLRKTADLPSLVFSSRRILIRR